MSCCKYVGFVAFMVIYAATDADIANQEDLRDDEIGIIEPLEPFFSMPDATYPPVRPGSDEEEYHEDLQNHWINQYHSVYKSRRRHSWHG